MRQVSFARASPLRGRGAAALEPRRTWGDHEALDLELDTVAP